MRFLGSVGAKAAPPALPPDAGSVRRTIPLPGYRLGQPYTGSGHVRSDTQFIRDTHDRVTWVFSAVRAVAHNAARLKVIARTGDPEDGPQLASHFMLPLLNFRSSPYTNEQAYAFRHRLSAQLELCTRGAFVETVRSRGGDVIALHLYPPGVCTPVPDPIRFVSEYLVTIGNDKVAVPPERIMWIKNPHPSDPYRSMTSFEAAGMAIDTDWLAHLYNANFMRKDGRGAGIVAVKGGLEDDDADEIKTWFQGGVETAGEWHVIEGDELSVVDMATSPRDAQYIESRGLSKEEIFIGAGVPESVAGNASGRTFDNADAEKENFWQEKMLGHLELVAGGYDLLDGDPNTFIVHDTSKVPALQRAAMARRQEMRDEVNAGVRSIDSYLEAVGEDPLGLPETEVPLISITKQPVGYVPPVPQPVENILDVPALEPPKVRSRHPLRRR